MDSLSDNIEGSSSGDKSIEELIQEAAKSNEPSLDEQLFSVFSILENNPKSKLDDYEALYNFNKALHDEYVIKPEDVPYSHFEAEQRMARERGHGNVPITEEYKKQKTEIVQKDQKQSLDVWLNYLTSPYSLYMPSSTKYWVLSEVVKLGRYDKATQTFNRREKDTVAPFVELNAEALAYVSDTLVKKYGEEYINLSDEVFNTNIELKKAESLKKQSGRLKLVDSAGAEDKGKVVLVKDEDGRTIPIEKKNIASMRENIKEAGGEENVEESFKKANHRLEELELKRIEVLKKQEVPGAFSMEVGVEDFGEIYAYAVNEFKPIDGEEREIVEGQWVKYNQGTDHMVLYNALQGKGTGWCTAGGESTAKAHLDGGDFYVYYSNNLNGNPVNPRVAIRMQGSSQIAEIRGIDATQNMDPYISEAGILDEKFKEFGDEGERYKQKEEDMKRVTEIDHKVKAGGELNKEDLRFLYEIDREIEGFGIKKDPRIEEIINKRDIKGDLALVFDCNREEISLTEEEALKGGIIYHRGNLNLSELTSVEGLILPKRVEGYIDLSGLTSAEGLVLPDNIGGDLDLSWLTSAEGLVFPKRVGRDLNLSSLTSAEGLVLPDNIGRALDLSGLISAEGLVLPDNIGWTLNLSGLTSAEGLVLPDNIRGELDLSGLTSAEGLVLPDNIGMDIYLSGLTSAEGLVFPKSIRGSLFLYNLTSAEGLILPESIGESLSLLNLTSAEGLILPKSIGGFLDLSSLTSVEGLVLPDNIGRALDLSGLTNVEGLTLPERVGGFVRLNKSLISISELEELSKKYPHLDIELKDPFVMNDF